jgi:ribosomal protein S14
MRRQRDSLIRKLKVIKSADLIRSHLLRFLKRSDLAPIALKQYAILAMTLKKNHALSRTKVHTFCMVTGRIHYTIGDIYVSRLVVGEIGRRGNLVGYAHGS